MTSGSLVTLKNYMGRGDYIMDELREQIDKVFDDVYTDMEIVPASFKVNFKNAVIPEMGLHILESSMKDVKQGILL